MEQPPELFSCQTGGCPGPFPPSHLVFISTPAPDRSSHSKEQKLAFRLLLKEWEKVTCYLETGLRFLPSISWALTNWPHTVSLLVDLLLLNHKYPSVCPSQAATLPLLLCVSGFRNCNANDYIPSQFLLPSVHLLIRTEADLFWLWW